MDVVELTKEAIERANNESQGLKEKARDTVTSLSVEFKDDPARSFSFYINKGELKFSEEKIPDAEFEITITKEDFYYYDSKSVWFNPNGNRKDETNQRFNDRDKQNIADFNYSD